MKIGFIGLGIMGSRMAANLQKNDYELVVHNRTPDKAKSLLDNGATWADSPAEVAQQVDILITMLSEPSAVSAVALGADGFLDHLPADHLWVDCSTVNPIFSRQMATEASSRQIRFVDAPVAGSKGAAADAQLLFVVGGDAADVEACKPLFDGMGRATIHVGGHGMGTSLKMVLNHMLATSMAAFAEGMILGEALGIEQSRLLEILLGGPVVAPFTARKRPMIESDNYEAEFPLRLMQKDLHMAAVAAYEYGAAMPLSNAAKETYRLAMQSGLADEDFAAIYRFLKSGSGK